VRSRGGILAIAFVALAVRIAYVAFVVGDDPVAGDAIYYSAQAEVITRGDFFDHPFTGEPAADHPPVTALLLALPSLGPGDPALEQRIFMAFLGTAAVVAIAGLGHLVGGRRVGLVAGSLAAVHPGLWINDGLAMSETPTALVTAVLLIVAIRWRRGEVPSWVLGVVGGVAALTRAELALLVALVVATSVTRRWREWLPAGALVAASAAAVMAPWTAFNLVRFEEPVAVSTNDGLTLLGSNCDPAYGDGLGFWHLSCAFETEGDQSEVSSAYRAEAVDYARAHADRLPKVVAARIGRVWSLYRPMDMVHLNTGEGRPETASRLAVYAWFGLAALGGCGLWLLRRRQGPWLLLLLPGVSVTVVAALTYGIPRFRLSAEVALIPAAALALVHLASRAGERASPTPDGPRPPRGAARPA
jgi:4-amino-4-deoxy-L-arabinose transferase-like glycosyltransferase